MHKKNDYKWKYGLHKWVNNTEMVDMQLDTIS